MSGGEPFSGLNRFTLYTPNTAAIIQRFLESKAVFDSRSPTGFSRWNAATSRMEPYSHRIDVIREINALIKDLSEANLAELLSKYDLVKVAMADGNWKAEIPLPPASMANRGRIVSIDRDATFSSVLFRDGQQVQVPHGFKKDYLSNGMSWEENDASVRGVERKPQHFGVPVVTLVGYYDPEERLQSYIYPALHGACGFCYADESSTLNDLDCHLLVETRDGVLRFRLASHRLGERCMNKFHVNVPEASNPRRVTLVLRGRVVVEKSITPVNEKLIMTVNGIPVSRSDRPKVQASPGVSR